MLTCQRKVSINRHLAWFCGESSWRESNAVPTPFKSEWEVCCFSFLQQVHVGKSSYHKNASKNCWVLLLQGEGDTTYTWQLWVILFDTERCCTQHRTFSGREGASPPGRQSESRGWVEIKDFCRANISLQIVKTWILSGYLWFPTSQLAFQSQVAGLLDEYSRGL